METTVKERLTKFIKYKGLSQKKFEEVVGLSNGYVNNIRRSITIEKLQKIALCFPELNKTWILTGEGTMLIDATSTTQKVNPSDIPSNAVPSDNAIDIEYAGANHNDGIFYRDRISGQLYISVPHVPYSARGEFPNLSDTLEPDGEWTREVYKVDRMARGRYISFDVRGNSMDNGMRRCLQDGDKVLVRELERDNWRTLRAGDHRYWVLVFGSSVLIKEISDFDSSTGVITCHSLNPSPEYQDFTVSLDDVRSLYYVIRYKPHEEVG